MIQYKGFEIKVNDDGRFIATDSEGKEEAFDYTLQALKDKLDAISKKQIRMRVWIASYDKLEEGTLTSIKQTRGYGGAPSFYARVSYDKGTWNETNPNSVFPMNPENDQLAKEYIAIHDHINQLTQSGAEIRKKMKSINIQELLK